MTWIETVDEDHKNVATLISRLADRTSSANEKMYSGYFAMVMATGIVSTALSFQKVRDISEWLFWINLIAYPVLIVATVNRAFRFGAKLWADLTNAPTMFMFFTFVAGSNVLGIQFLLRGYRTPALALWILASVCCLALAYFCFSALTFMNTRPLVEAVNASWLILIVGTQSVTVLGALLAPGFGRNAEIVLLLLYGFWGIGIALYGIFITLIVYRLFFARLDPGEMLPPYWIILGATAISALAGANLLAAAPSAPLFTTLQPTLQGVTLLLLAWSSWWIPLLIIYGLWRHLVCRVPMTYHPAYWSLVFPLGMYAVATYRVSVVMHIAPLQGISSLMVWVALSAWGITMFGPVQSLVRILVQSPILPAPLREEKKA
jgi:tellurite resistance protein TehA-like permease